MVCLLFTWAAVSEVFDIGYWKRHRTLNYDIETYTTICPPPSSTVILSIWVMSSRSTASPCIRGKVSWRMAFAGSDRPVRTC